MNVSDIKKLVGEMQMYLTDNHNESLPSIEVDILMQKTRELYDALAKMKSQVPEQHEDIQANIVEVVVEPPVETKQEEPAQETMKDNKEVVEISFEDDKIEIKTEPQTVDPHAQSLGESFQSLNKEDLGSKLGKAPISNIKGAMSLGERFEYQSQLFNNKADVMNAAIDALESKSSLSEAQAYIKENFNWDEDDSTVQRFLSLVERRFL